MGMCWPSKPQHLCLYYHVLDTSFVISHFSYCPLGWMFHNRKSYNKINKIHERALRIIHMDSTSNFENLLIKSNSVSIHQRNLQLLLIEIYKTVNNLNPSFMAEVFVTNVVPYNLRGSTNLVLPKARTNLYGWNRYFQVCWSKSMAECAERNQRVPIIGYFQKKYKAIPLDCSCKLCKI